MIVSLACEDGTRMNWTEMRMIRGMFEVKLDEGKKSDELRELEPVSLMIKNSRLSCFGHVERSPNLLSPDVFSVVKFVRHALAAGARRRTPLENL